MVVYEHLYAIEEGIEVALSQVVAYNDTVREAYGTIVGVTGGTGVAGGEKHVFLCVIRNTAVSSPFACFLTNAKV